MIPATTGPNTPHTPPHVPHYPNHHTTTTTLSLLPPPAIMRRNTRSTPVGRRITPTHRKQAAQQAADTGRKPTKNAQARAAASGPLPLALPPLVHHVVLAALVHRVVLAAAQAWVQVLSRTLMRPARVSVSVAAHAPSGVAAVLVHVAVHRHQHPHQHERPPLHQHLRLRPAMPT